MATSSPQPQPPVLEIWKGGRLVGVHRLEAGRLTIGRGAGSDIRLDDLRVSRTHGLIERRSSGGFVVIDLASRRGTLLDGRRLLPEHPAPLYHNSRITIVERDFVFRDPAHAQAQESAPPPTSRLAEDLMVLSTRNVGAGLTPCAASPDDRNPPGPFGRLLEVSRILGNDCSSSSALNRELDRLRTEFPAADGCMLLAADAGAGLSVLARAPDQPDLGPGTREFHEVLAERSLQLSQAMLVTEVPEAYPDRSTSYGKWVRAWLSVPVLGMDERPIALVQLFSKKFHAHFGWEELAKLCRSDGRVHDPPSEIRWTSSDLERLVEQTRSLGLAIDFQHLEGRVELAVCRQIQASVTRAAHYEMPGYAFQSGVIPGQEYRGSFTGLVPVPSDDAPASTPSSATLVLGEVAVKGIRAALIMADLNLEIHRLLEIGLDLPEVLARANGLLVAALGTSTQASVLLARMDTANHTLTVASAGQSFPVILRTADFMEILDSTYHAIGPPLGLEANPIYRTLTTKLEQGDRVHFTPNALASFLPLWEDDPDSDPRRGSRRPTQGDVPLAFLRRNR